MSPLADSCARIIIVRMIQYMLAAQERADMARINWMTYDQLFARSSHF